MLVPVGDSSSDLYVSLDLHLPSLLSSMLRQRCDRVLFLAEPRSIKPLQYRAPFLRMFTHVYSPSSLYPMPAFVATRAYSWSPWWPSPPRFQAHESRRLREIGMISGDKVSFIPGQQYELRRRVIQDWPRDAPAALRPAGTGWQRAISAIVRTYLTEAARALGAGHAPKGLIESLFRRVEILPLANQVLPFPGAQVDYLAQFEFALVIENEPTIVTEKFWQALEAGCIPLYFGPPLQKFGISSACAIQLNSLDELFEFRFLELTAAQRNAIRAEGRRVLSEAEPFTYMQSVKSIVREIGSLLSP